MAIGRWESVSPAMLGGRSEVDFERCVQENERVVYRVAYGVLGNPADAEEVTQDVFLRAYRKLSSLRDPDKFRAWITRMARRLALNCQRASNRALRRQTAWAAYPAPSAATVDSEIADSDFQSRLRDEIDAMSEKLRSVLMLCAIDGLSAREVAAILRIPECTVRSRLHLARKHLLRRIL